MAEVLLLELHEVGADSSIESLEYWDSLAMVQIVMRVETEFSIRFHYRDTADVKGVEDLVRLVVGKLNC